MLLRRRQPRDGNPAVPLHRLPAVNTHVEVCTERSGPRPSRVEDAASGVVLVSWPTDAAGYRLTSQPGDLVSLTWTSQWGIHEVTGSLTETCEEPVPLWTVQAMAAPAAQQRREAFRLEIRLALQLRPCVDGSGGPGHGGEAAGEVPQAIEAATEDLSEGGLGFVVAAGSEPETGSAVEVTLPLDDGDLTVRATVVRIGKAADGRCSGGMRFEGMSEEAATRLRRFVLQEQIRRRALVRG